MTTLELRGKYLEGARTVLIKVGSAVLTDQNGLNLEVMRSLASQIDKIRGMTWVGAKKMCRRVIMVSSGSVAAGKAKLRQVGISTFSDYIKARHGIAAIGQSLLMRAWNDAFQPHGIITGQVLLTGEDLRSRERFQIARDTFSEMLSWDVIPIVNENDTVSVVGLNYGDNDYLASLLVNVVEADLFINLTSAAGVLDGNPDEKQDCRIINCIEDIAGLDLDTLCGKKSELGTGGMRSKLLAARRVAQLGVPTLVLPGREKNVLEQAFDISGGQQPGTLVCPSTRTIPRRKFWLAYQSMPAGDVEIDAGAAHALLHGGGSLLPGGVTGVIGAFDKGSLVRVVHNGKNLGVGFCNYDSDSLGKIKGLKRHEVAAMLGDPRYPDVIHRDNLLLEAAIQE